MNTPTPLEQMIVEAITRKKIVIGLPAPHGGADRCFPLTPEAAGLLVANGFSVKMQASGADTIHYPDIKYQQQGVEIVDRAEAFRADIVIYLSPLSTMDVRMMRNGSLLFTMMHSVIEDIDVLRLLMHSRVISLALDLVADNEGHHPFADILSEISGLASIAVASSLLADPVYGKGILLGGIAGIVPCEVTIIGSGIDACAAARSAIGLGAIVRMFDNDIYRLRNAMRQLGAGVSGSALHPKVLVHALRSADVVVATSINPRYELSADVVAEMKLGVITIDLSAPNASIFPSLRQVDMGMQPLGTTAMRGQRVCYVNPANSVPRTVAMALSNSFLTMITNIFSCDGLTNALMLNQGLQEAALTFLGKAVNATVASALGVRQTDIKLILQFS